MKDIADSEPKKLIGSLPAVFEVTNSTMAEDSIMQFLVMTKSASSLVTNKYFRDMIHNVANAGPSFKLPDRHAFG